MLRRHYLSIVLSVLSIIRGFRLPLKSTNEQGIRVVINLQAFDRVRQWLFEGDLPHPQDSRLPLHPEFLYRLNGEWTSWSEFLQAENESNAKQDLVDKFAWQLYSVLFLDTAQFTTTLEVKAKKRVFSWLTECELNSPTDERLPKHPEFIFRFTGDWSGWADFRGLRPGSKRYLMAVKQDKIDSAAWDLLQLLTADNGGGQAH